MPTKLKVTSYIHCEALKRFEYVHIIGCEHVGCVS